MSGNPFRKQPQSDESSNVRGSGSPVPSITTDPERRASKVKRVRIQTPPPLSPDSIHGPSPAASPFGEHSSFANDSFSYFGREVLIDKPLRSDAVKPVSQKPEDVYPEQDSSSGSETEGEKDSVQLTAPLPTGRGYVNPFEKTLADIESTRNTNGAPEKTAPGRPSAKASMDVDSFTRLMMGGGSAVPSDTSMRASSQHDGTQILDRPRTNGVMKDLSQQVRPSQAAASEPSMERPPDQEDGKANTGENYSRQKIKPPTPQPRHGKPVPTRTPQVVSFDDFAPADRPVVNGQMSRDLPPTPRDRSSSDINKTALQQSQFPFPSADKAQPGIESNGSSNFAPTSPSSYTAKQALSPHPSGQPKGANHIVQPVSRNRADSNLSDASSSSKSRAPPPPPARRGAARTSSVTSPFPDITMSSPQPESERGSKLFDSDLDVSQARRPSATSLSSNRSASGSFTNTRINMPPPPPPRRRGSGKGNLQPGRASAMASAMGEYERRGSGGSLRRPSGEMLEDVEEGETSAYDHRDDMTQERKTSADMLSDLDALQKEIDALQNQQRRTSGG